MSCFRYYNWLPIDLEPEYSEGFSCDVCEGEFLTGPLYHNATSGKDYCVLCGQSEGLSMPNALICSLLFPEEDVCRFQDTKTNSLAVLIYRVSKNVYGIHFSNGSTVLFQLTDMEVVRVIRLQGGKFDNEDTWEKRFPWLSASILQYFSLTSSLHAVPEDNLTELGEVYLVHYSISERSFSLTLNNGWEQLFFLEDGLEIIAKDGAVVSFLGNDSHSTLSKDSVDRLYREGLSAQEL